MMINDGNMDEALARFGHADIEAVGKFQAFLRTRRMLREAVARRGLDSPEASALRLDLIRMMHEFKTGG